MPAKDPKFRPESIAYPVIIAFTVSASVLLLQLVQTRIYSVVFWNHLVYFIVSVALMGFGVSGTWMSFGTNTWVARRLTLRVAAVLFVASTLVSSFLMPRLAPGMGALLSRGGPFTMLLLTYAVAILPYFFAGWMLGGVFSRHVARIHLLYFSDLIGAAAGCALYLAGMQRLGAVHLVLAACALTAVPVLCAEGRAWTRVAVLAPTLAVLIGLGFAEGAVTQSIRPEPSKAYNTLFQNLPEGVEKVVELTEWNAVSRIDVVSSANRPGRFVFIDGDAWTTLITTLRMPPPPYVAGEFATGGESAYFFSPKVDDVLVLGTGGGLQVYEALRAGASHVDAVEINPTTWRLPLQEYRAATKDLMFQPGVRAYREEGRSFVRRSGRRYDVIAIHGIDTFAALNAGAYMLAENYLYTVEALKDYVRALTDDGTLIISRWFHYAETPRLFAVALEALTELGVPNPAGHIIVHRAPDGVGTLMLRATPYSQEEIARFRRSLESTAGKQPTRLIFPRADGELEQAQEIVIAAYAQARAEGRAEAYLDSLAFKIAPVYDDSPFFFHFDKPLGMMDVIQSDDPGEYIRGNWPSFTLFTLLGFSGSVVAILMVLPLARRGRPRVPGFGAWLVYFSSIGVAFIFIEIVLMQRFALLLGHPSRSLALVLASLLFFAGIGSYARGAFRIPVSVALGCLAGLILLAAYGYPAAIEAVLPYSLLVRGAATVALVAPLGFFMGMPFPAGLAAVSRAGGGVVPWMWGINGATTVLGSVLAIVLAIDWSFTLVTVLACLGYGLTLMAYLYLRRRLGYEFAP